MSRSLLFLVGIAGSIAAAIGACSASGTGTSLGAGGTGTTSTTGMGGAPSASSSGGGGTIAVGSGGSGGNGGGPTLCEHDPNEDGDNDGFTFNEGDCNDCDRNVNPDAVDTPLTAGMDGGIVDARDNNCDGKIEPNPICDSDLLLEDVDPMSAVKAIDICQTTLTGKSWGLISAKYVGADGKSPRSPGLQVGLLDKFGTSPNVKPRLGNAMLGLSSGHMRAPGQTGFCVDPLDDKLPSQNCENPTSNGPPPTGFPQKVPPPCQSGTEIHDDIALELKLRAPSNATGYKFTFKFYSFEYPEWVCGFNDQFVALVSPPPAGAINGNISFDSKNNPVSVNIAFFDVCDPTTKDMYAKLACNGCVPAPIPYCPKGTTELEGTGMFGGTLDGGGTSWLETTAPLVAGQREFTIRFAIWDTSDHSLDSHVLIDSFKWIATPGVKLGTVPPS